LLQKQRTQELARFLSNLLRPDSFYGLINQESQGGVLPQRDSFSIVAQHGCHDRCGGQVENVAPCLNIVGIAKVSAILLCDLLQGALTNQHSFLRIK
jgi:hypothetical protein